MSYPKSGLSTEQVEAIARIPMEHHCAYELSVPLLLTTTPQLITNWVSSTISPPVGVVQNGGIFTTSVPSGVLVILERTYKNGDKRPDEEIQVTITINSGGNVVFTSTLPIPPAVLNRGDGVLSVTDPFLIPVSVGSEFGVFVSASEAGATPTDTSLVRARLTSTAVYAFNGV